MSSEDRRPLPPPISDESLEYWTTEYEFGAGVAVGPISRSHFGGLLARIKKAEDEGNKTILELRDLLRRVLDVTICIGHVGLDGYVWAHNGHTATALPSDLAAECASALEGEP
jgi:hypothetical protein